MFLAIISLGSFSRVSGMSEGRPYAFWMGFSSSHECELYFVVDLISTGTDNGTENKLVYCDNSWRESLPRSIGRDASLSTPLAHSGWSEHTLRPDSRLFLSLRDKVKTSYYGRSSTRSWQRWAVSRLKPPILTNITNKALSVASFCHRGELLINVQEIPERSKADVFAKARSLANDSGLRSRL